MCNKLIWQRAVVIFTTLFVLLVLLLTPLAEAATWRFSPSLDLSESFSNNLTLASEGKEISGFVTQLNPGFSILADGRRINFSLSYRLQNKFYPVANYRNYSSQQFLASFDSEPIRNVLFFDGNASYRQMLITPLGKVGQGNIALNNNLQDVATTNLTPYLKKRFGNWALGALRYGRNTVNYINRETSTFDSYSNSIDGQLNDAQSLGRWSWSMAFSARNVTYLSDLRGASSLPLPGEKWRNVDYTQRYSVSQLLSLSATVGYEDNVYLRNRVAVEPKGPYWNVGVTWRPTTRSSVVIGRGERYYGPTWNLDLSHNWRRSTLRANYVHDVSTRRQNLLGVPVFDSEGNPVIDPDTSEQLTGTIPALGVFIRQRASLGVEYRMRKMTSSIDITKEFRQYQSKDGGDEVVDGGVVKWRWNFSRRGSLMISSRIELRDVIDSYLDKLSASRAILERKLGRGVVASIEANRTKRKRNIGINYTENILTARLTMRW